MSSVVRGLVEGIGITPFEELPVTARYFTEIAVPETVELPEEKPDMEQLLSVMVDAEVVSVRIVNTPITFSREGQYLAGRKLILEIKLRQKIKYVADVPSQSVHAAHYDKLINSVYIVMPERINNVPIEVLLKNNKLVITPYIEDIYGSMLDCRRVFKNIVLFVDVKVV